MESRTLGHALGCEKKSMKSTRDMPIVPPAALLKHKALRPFARNMAIESEMVAPHSVVKRTNGVEAVKRTPAYIMVVAYRGANRPASPDPSKKMSKRTCCVTW